jgi:Tfp pilus assembly protein PilW
MTARPSSLTPRPGLRPRRQAGLSLVEMAVSLGVASIALVVIGLLSLHGLRSFAVMGSFADVDEKGRLAVDRISRDLRQATGVLRYQSNADRKTLVLTNALAATAVTYVWDADTRTLTSEERGELPSVCLSDCESWSAAFFQDLPQPSTVLPLLPATNSAGQPDLKLARVVKLTWRCSRRVPGTQVTTESAPSVLVVLRNAPQ